MNERHQVVSGGETEEKGKDVKTPALKAFGRDLTEIARKGEMDPVVGREKKFEELPKFFVEGQKIIPC